ncbi:MAG: glycoside hydrolase family 5 protein [Oscillospiraceae bacterium]|nr:glycoside hydrolase family 5 protein [Oscillospiraceae bacterium]
MKKIIVIIAAAVVCLAAVGTVLLCGKHETASDAAKNITVGWNLGNTLDSNGDWIGMYTDGLPENYETAWGNPVTTPELIAAVKAAGFNAVRVPVTWREHIDESGNIDPAWLDRVTEVVDYVIEQDMYCVLNVHHDSGGGGWLRATPECYAESSAKFAALWKNIAEHFKDYGDKLIFEGFNEMLDSENRWGGAGSEAEYMAHNDFNQLFVDTVRATGGNNTQRNLMLQVYSGVCGEGALENFVLPQDSAQGHLMIQVHCYDPQPFTWTSVDYAAPRYDWGSDSDKLQLDDIFRRLSELSERCGAPLVIGECGADYKESEAARKAYVTYFLSCAKAADIKCFWWDTGAMSLFDRESCTELYPEITDIIDELT